MSGFGFPQASNNAFSFQFPSSQPAPPTPQRNPFDGFTNPTPKPLAAFTNPNPPGFSINAPAPPMDRSFSFMMNPSSGRTQPTFMMDTASGSTLSKKEPTQWAWTWFCNVCRTQPTTGPRLHCAHCADFDLCSSCDKKNDTLLERGEEPLHDKGHVFVKSRPQ